MESKKLYLLYIIVFGTLFYLSCKTETNGIIQKAGRKPTIEPDYSDVTIPPNIAPMNFKIKEDAKFFRVTAISETNRYKINIKSSDGIIRFHEKSWRKLISDCKDNKIIIQIYSSDDKKIFKQYEPFYMHVSNEPIDPYLTYRLIYPGYYSWSNIKIVQRSVESFNEESLIENQILDMNCVNCHSFDQYNSERFLVQIRGSKGGTYFVDDSKITRRDLKIEAMPGGATYPAWHPGGRYVAFSSNQVRQHFYACPAKSTEVFDIVSSLILFDIENTDIVQVKDQDTTRYLQTFPSWSPDGRYLYFCRALQSKTTSNLSLEEIEATKYDIVRMPFNPESASFGKTEIVLKTSENGKSASFPRISPDGKYLIFTLADYGTFPIWHQEADLYLLNLQTAECKKMDLNSDDTESYHTWSSNGKWLVFSSKRTDGRSTRPFFAYFDSWDHTGKPFILPQKDPTLYGTMMESFNIPEFVNGRIRFTPRDFAAAARIESIKVNPRDPQDSLTLWEMQKVNVKRNSGEKSIHE